MKATLADLLIWLPGAALHAQANDAAFDGVSTDSRSVAAGNLFVALRGEHFDAHEFLHEVAAKNVAAVLVESLPHGLSVPAIVVPDTRVALGEVARHWRARFSLPVIAVTGSNGKTTVKEMLASILAAAFGDIHSLATRGNLNNEIGVPLTVMRMDAQHQAAVIELGMNHPGEIEVLAKIAQPTVALVNNAQREHLEFMESVEAVAKENGAVIQSLASNGVAVFPADDAYASLWHGYAKAGGCKSLTFGLSEAADVRGSYAANAFGSEIEIQAGERHFKLSLAAAGEHNVKNALAASACALAAGIAVEHIVRGLESFAPVKGRLQRKSAANGAMLIDDTYNANPDSVRAAIDVLAQAAAPRLLVLGDMGEVGNEGPRFHEEVGAYARQQGIAKLYALGELARHAVSAFGTNAVHCNDIDSLNAALEQVVEPQHAVLVKGSRFMKMERVVQHLVDGQNKNKNKQSTGESH